MNTHTATLALLFGQEVSFGTIAGPVDFIDVYVDGNAAPNAVVEWRLYATVGTLTSLVAISTGGGKKASVLKWQGAAGAYSPVQADGSVYELRGYWAQQGSPPTMKASIVGYDEFDTAAASGSSSTQTVPAGFGEVTFASGTGYSQFADAAVEQNFKGNVLFILYALSEGGGVEAPIDTQLLSSEDGTTRIFASLKLPGATSYRLAAQDPTGAGGQAVTASLACYSTNVAGAVVGLLGTATTQQMPQAASSRVLDDISSDDWTRTFPTLAFKVQTNDPVFSPDSNECNPYRDAPVNGLRSWKFLTASDETEVTFSVTMARVPGDIVETVAIAFVDASGGTVLAKLAIPLTDNLVEYSLKLDVAPNTIYSAILAVNNATFATTTQARGLLTDIKLSGNSKLSVFAQAYTRLHVTPASVTDNAEPITNVTDIGYIKSAFCRSVFQTTATEILLEYFSTLASGGFPNQGNILVMVNGDVWDTIAPTGNGSLVYVAVTLPAGDKTVEIVEASNFEPYPTMLVTSVRAIYVPAAASTKFVRPSPAQQMAVYGDSIDIGYFEVPASLIAWCTRARQWFPGNIQLECYGGRRLYDDQTAPGGFNALAQKISKNNPTTVLITVGINDQNNPGQTVAQFQTQYGNMLVAFHQWMPSAILVCAVPLITSTEDVPNANGDYVRDFREAIIVAASGKNYAQVDWRSGAVTPAMLSATVHPDNQGVDYMQRWDRGALGLGAVQLPAIQATDPGPTILERWQAIPASITIAGGKVSAWTGLINGKVLAQATAGNRPTYSSTAGPNGFGAVQFRNAAASFLQWAAGKAEPNPLWFQIVLKMAAVAAPLVKDVILDGAVGVASLVLATDTTPETYIGTVGTNVTIAAVLSTAEWNVVNGIFNLGASELDVEFGQTPGPILTATGTTLATSPDGLTVGALQGNTGFRGADFDIVEITLYQGSVPTAQEWNAQIEGRLKALYQL